MLVWFKMAYENWFALFDLDSAVARLSADERVISIVYDKWKSPQEQIQGEIRVLKSDILFTEFRHTPLRANIIVRTRSADGKKRNYNFVFKPRGWDQPDTYPADEFYNELFGFVHC